MGVFLRYIRRSMLEKKGRFILLLISIMICTALLIVSLGLIDVIIYSYTEPTKSAAEGQDIHLFSNTEDVYFSEEDFDNAGLKNLQGELANIGVIYENDEISYIKLRARKSYDGDMIEGKLENSSAPECIVSDRIAKERDLKVGDKLTIAISGQPTELTVKGIAANKGCFYGDTATGFNILLPYDYLNERLGADGRYNRMTAQVDGKPGDFTKDFNDKNERVKAEALIDEDLDEGTETITVPLYLMLAIVCIVCVIIINGVFKLIITERITVIGTFMSQGATKKKIEHILLCEALLYGLSGAVLGVAVGEVALIFVTRYFSPLKDYGIYVPYKFNIGHMIAAVLFAVALSVISAWSPVRRIRKMQVKDVILDRFEDKVRRGRVRFIAGLVLLGICFAGYITSAEVSLGGSVLLMFCGFLGMVMASRKLIKIIADGLSRLLRGNTTAYLAMNNIKSSKLLRGNVTLLMISLSAVLMIASIGQSMEDIVVDAYDTMECDYTVMNIIDNASDVTTTEYIVDMLNEVEGIDKSSLNPLYAAVAKLGNEYAVIEAADPDIFADYMQYLELNSDKYKDDYAEYKNADDRAIVLSLALSKKLDLKKGDTAELEVDGKKEEFRIAAIVDAKLLNGGTIILMKPEDLKEVYNVREANEITFKLEPGADAETVEAQFKKPLANLGATFMTLEEMKQQNVEQNAVVIDLLSVFSFLALCISSIGIFNNITICFAQRRREFAVMASVGMNKRKRRALVLIESLFCTLLSIAASIPFTIMICGLVTKMMLANSTPMDVAFAWSQVPLYLGVLAAVIFIASISTMRKSARLSVVQELKYE
ncbi:MAG: ABC transporter permease [Ruminococcus sp.]|nr:ABC transporter permease [Ruminococcus sp.]